MPACACSSNRSTSHNSISSSGAKHTAAHYLCVSCQLSRLGVQTHNAGSLICLNRILKLRCASNMPLQLLEACAVAATSSTMQGASQWHASDPQDMFNKAKHPQRVFVAAVQQIYEFREACWHTGLPWGEQIRTITVPFSEAKGPTNARHQAASLYRNEDYFLQIDSHTTFIQVCNKLGG